MTMATTQSDAAPASLADSRTTPVNGIPVHFAERGDGAFVLALHGWMVDHRFMTGVLEPLIAERSGYRRLYPDLPGMGHTPAPEGIASSDDMLEIALGFIDAVIGDAPFLLVGHSHGAYLARAIASRRPDQVVGLGLISPLGGEVMGPEADVPDHVVLHRSGKVDGILDPALEGEFPGYLVVQTPETVRRFGEREGPGFALADFPALERIHERFALRDDPGTGPPFTKPTLIVTGRQDSTVGYVAQWQWLEHYPRATYAVLDRAGHGLPHEQPTLLDALLTEWLDRVAESRAGDAAGFPPGA